MVCGFSPVETSRLSNLLMQQQNQHYGNDNIANIQHYVQTETSNENHREIIKSSDVLSNEPILYFSNENGNYKIKGLNLFVYKSINGN